jgi:hypothetical protein
MLATAKKQLVVWMDGHADIQGRGKEAAMPRGNTHHEVSCYRARQLEQWT